MTKIAIPVSILILALFGLQGCKEVPPFINYTEPDKPLLDTTYIVTTLPAVQSKRVLLFDVTGVRCNNCPNAALKAEEISNNNPGKVSVLGLFITSSPSLTAPWPGYDTLSSSTSEYVMQNIEAPGSLPKGSVDQAKFNGARMIEPTEWTSRVAERLLLTTPVNLETSSQYNSTTREARISVKATYTQNVTVPHKMVIAIMENGIIGKQSTLTGHEDAYEFNHVLRTTLTDPTGLLLTDALNAGRVYEKQYKFVIPAKWKAENCKVIAWIYESTDKNVQQVSEAFIK